MFSPLRSTSNGLSVPVAFWPTQAVDGSPRSAPSTQMICVSLKVPLTYFARNSERLPVTSMPFQGRSEEHTSELQSLMRISYAVFCLKKNTTIIIHSNKHI